LLREALEVDPEAGRFILISGQDYPLMTPAGMAAFFENKPDFFTYHSMPWEAWSGAGGFDRLRRYHFSMGRYSFTYPSDPLPVSRIARVASRACEWFLPSERPLPAEIAFHGGSNWWNLTRRSAELVFEFLRANRGFERLFRYTRSADEIFFQTVLLNAPSPPLVKNEDLRCVFWDGRRNELPATLRIEDFEEVAASGKLFARKMHPENSGALMDRIDDLLSS
jgi:hypothetical protein